MGVLKDRMKYAGPIWAAMRDRLEEIIKVSNASRLVVLGLNPHKADDSTNIAAAADAALDTIEEARDASQAIYVAFEAHRAATANHTAADATNTLSAEPTPEAVYDLLNQVKAKHNAHIELTAGPVHGAADTANAVAAADADTKAKAITLANAIRTAYEAHRILTDSSVHGAADSVNAIAIAALGSDATWVQIAALADDIKAKYNAHRVLTTESVHDGADSTNAVTQEDVGTVTTRDYACFNDIKAKLNAHILLGTAHGVIDQSVSIKGVDATTEATGIALMREVIPKYRKHISRAVYIEDYPAIEEI